MRKLLAILNATLKHRTPWRGGGIPCLNLKTVTDPVFFSGAAGADELYGGAGDDLLVGDGLNNP